MRFGRGKIFKVRAVFGLAVLWAWLCMGTYGCSSISTSEAKLSDLDFTVVSETNIQEDIKDLIEEKKEEPFQMTYSDGNYKYIVVGYGKQEGGGYSIQVNQVYDTENTICVQTTLLGPEEDEIQTGEPSYPYIVIKIENLDKTVVFPES